MKNLLISNLVAVAIIAVATACCLFEKETFEFLGTYFFAYSLCILTFCNAVGGIIGISRA